MPILKEEIEKQDDTEYEIFRDPREAAESMGLAVVMPKDDEIQIDIDDEEQYTLFLKRWEELKKYLPAICIFISPSKGGFPKRHITMTFEKKNLRGETPPFTDAERVLYQAMLGSDPTREWISFLRVAAGKAGFPVSCFFEKKT